MEHMSMKLVIGVLHLKFSGKFNYGLYHPIITLSLYDTEIRIMTCLKNYIFHRRSMHK
jgi:hypothetical protein